MERETYEKASSLINYIDSLTTKIVSNDRLIDKLEKAEGRSMLRVEDVIGMIEGTDFYESFGSQDRSAYKLLQFVKDRVTEYHVALIDKRNEAEKEFSEL